MDPRKLAITANPCSVRGLPEDSSNSSTDRSRGCDPFASDADNRLRDEMDPSRLANRPLRRPYVDGSTGVPGTISTSQKSLVTNEPNNGSSLAGPSKSDGIQSFEGVTSSHQPSVLHSRKRHPPLTNSSTHSLSWTLEMNSSSHPSSLTADMSSDVERDAAKQQESYSQHGIWSIRTSRRPLKLALFAGFGGSILGFNQGTMTVRLNMHQYITDFPTKTNETSLVTYQSGYIILNFVGSLLGALFIGFFPICRLFSIRVTSYVLIIGGAIQCAAPKEYGVLLFARLVFGGGIGMLTTVLPIYVAEITSPEIRGTLLVVGELAKAIGAVLGFWFEWSDQFGKERGSYLGVVVLGLWFCNNTFFLTPSPRSQILNAKSDQALENLAKLRQLTRENDHVKNEWKDIYEEDKSQEEIRSKRYPGTVKGTLKMECYAWGDCFRKHCLKRTYVGVTLMVFQQAVGINTLNNYLPLIFKSLGSRYNLSLILSGSLYIAQGVGVVICLLAVDIVGRKRLLMCGSVILAVCHIVLVGIIASFHDEWASHEDATLASIFLLFIYIVGFGATWGSVASVMPAEIFPTSLRSRGMAFSMMSGFLLKFPGEFLGPHIIKRLGWKLYLICAICLLLSGIWAWFYVPEITGKPLEKMDELFIDSGGVDDDERRVRICRNLSETETASNTASLPRCRGSRTYTPTPLKRKRFLEDSKSITHPMPPRKSPRHQETGEPSAPQPGRTAELIQDGCDHIPSPKLSSKRGGQVGAASILVLQSSMKKGYHKRYLRDFRDCSVRQIPKSRKGKEPQRQTIPPISDNDRLNVCINISGKE